MTRLAPIGLLACFFILPATGWAQEAPPADNTDLSCTQTELIQRSAKLATQITGVMAKDQSQATLERLSTAADRMTAINEKAGSSPSAQDCKDIDAIAKSLS